MLKKSEGILLHGVSIRFNQLDFYQFKIDLLYDMMFYGGGRRDLDRMVVGFITIYDISVYHH